MTSEDNERSNEGQIVIRVTIRDHLNRLEAVESGKPPALRLAVPTVAELADVTKVTRATLYNIDNGVTRAVNLDVMGAVMGELKQRGFETDISDLFAAYPADLV